MKKTSSLHKTMIIGLVLLSFFTVMLIFTGYAYLSKEVTRDISERNQSLARSIGTQAWYTLSRPAYNIKQLALYLNSEHDKTKQTKRINAMFSFSKLLEVVQVLDSSGHVKNVIPFIQEQIGLDLSRQPFFIKAISDKGLQWTDAFRSAQTESPMVTISTAYTGGVLAGHINLKVLSEITQIAFPESQRFICILDRKGVIIAHSDPQQALRGINLLNMKAVQKGLNGETGTFKDNFGSVRGLASVVPIREADWVAMVFQPEKEALSSINSLRSYALTAIMLITLSGMGAILFFRKMLLKPIETLTEKTAAVSLGKYDVRISPEYPEFETLAVSFNNMAETIGEREQQIFHEAQINKAQAEIVRTITESDSFETLAVVVHKWALKLTASSNSLVKIVKIKALSPKRSADKNVQKFTCYFSGDEKLDFLECKDCNGEICDTIFNNNQGVIINSYEQLQKSVTIPEANFKLARFMSTPVLHQGEYMGHLIVSNSSNDYTEQDLSTLQILADLLAVAVNRIRTDRTLISNEKKMRELRNYLSNIINSMPSMLIGVDLEGKISQWNKKAELETGLTRKKVLGHPLPEILPDLTDEMELVRLAIKTGQEQIESQKSSHRDGIARHEDITIYPLISDGIEGAVIRIDDVTDRVSMEQMMVQSEKMISLGGLAAGMAHEINNPLAAILGQNHNLKRRLVEQLPINISVAEECSISLDAMQEYMEKRDIPRLLLSIEESGNRAATIVKNMLSFSRKSEKRIGAYNLAGLMDQTIELASNDYDLKKEYDFRKIVIIRDYDPELPKVLCEGNEIQQVFLNLLKNGAEAMAEKEYQNDEEPQFIIRVFKDGKFAVVKIEDNGPGATEESRLRMFEPFFTTKEVGKGTGLGLSVSYFIITDQHSGNMKVESAPGEWTRFTITLPISGIS